MFSQDRSSLLHRASTCWHRCTQVWQYNRGRADEHQELTSLQGGQTWTKILLAQMQVWPAFLKADDTVIWAAVSTSASSKMIKGALPPNSRDTRLTVSAAPAASFLPTPVEPVKPIFRTVSDAIKVSPARPGRTCDSVHPCDAGGLIQQAASSQIGLPTGCMVSNPKYAYAGRWL